MRNRAAGETLQRVTDSPAGHPIVVSMVWLKGQTSGAEGQHLDAGALDVAGTISFHPHGSMHEKNITCGTCGAAQVSSGAKPESRVSGFFAAAKRSGLFVISVEEMRSAAKSLALSVITSLQKKRTA